MGKVQTSQDIHNVETWEDARRYVSQSLNAIVATLNGGVDLIDNATTSLVTVTFATANTELGVKHPLGRVPRGYLLVGRSADIRVFDGGTANTSQLIFLRASGAGTARLLVF